MAKKGRLVKDRGETTLKEPFFLHCLIHDMAGRVGVVDKHGQQKRTICRAGKQD